VRHAIGPSSATFTRAGPSDPASLSHSWHVAQVWSSLRLTRRRVEKPRSGVEPDEVWFGHADDRLLVVEGDDELRATVLGDRTLRAPVNVKTLGGVEISGGGDPVTVLERRLTSTFHDPTVRGYDAIGARPTRDMSHRPSGNAAPDFSFSGKISLVRLGLTDVDLS
jgi:hypothetical protein